MMGVCWLYTSGKFNICTHFCGCCSFCWLCYRCAGRGKDLLTPSIYPFLGAPLLPSLFLLALLLLLPLDDHRPLSPLRRSQTLLLPCCCLHRGLSGGEKLLTPGTYQSLLDLPSDRLTSNTWMTYTLSWQPDFITWAVNGVPVLTKVYDQEIKWVDMKGVNFR